MAKAAIYNNDTLAGTLEKKAADDYRFKYDEAYLSNPNFPAISLTLPKSEKEYVSSVLFSFFTGMLAEGINKDVQCRLLKIDEKDDFTRLLKTAGNDSIGAITVKQITT
jgi:HipA-like protein